jgi:hypothetical protein
MNWSRNCPECAKLIKYTSKQGLKQALERSRPCLACSQRGSRNQNYGNPRGFKHSEDTKRKISFCNKGRKRPDISGKNNPMKRQECRLKVSRSMIGKNRHASWNKGLTKEDTPQLANPNAWKNFGGSWNKGKKGVYSKETLKKMREARINYIESLHGKIYPNYNKDSISIIERYGNLNGYNFKHAENGGEIRIDGYYPDAVDLEKKVILEIDEESHYKDNELSTKDKNRQKYLEDLGYKIIRIRIKKYKEA